MTQLLEIPTSLQREPSPARLSGRDMLCFSHDWNSDPLSKTHLMRLLARENRVLWVNSIGYRMPTGSRSDAGRAIRKIKAAAGPMREVEKNLFVISPLVVPAYQSALMRSLNSRLLGWQVRRAMSKLGFTNAINWVFNPAAAVVAGSLGEDRLIYYCVDEYTAFSGVPSQALLELETRLATRADVVFVSSAQLLDAKSPLNPRTHLVRHGVDFKHFATALSPLLKVPEELARLPKPILGYFGLIASDWIDLPLLIKVAKRFPQASLVMLGKTTMDVSALSALPNVHLLGRKRYADLPAYCRGFDVALIPFPINRATLNSNPLKAREYLAAGLPVISTAIPEVQTLGQCRTANDHEAFCQQLELALKKPGPDPARSESMRTESWEARLGEIAEHINNLDAPSVADSLQVGLTMQSRA